jgi:hypothetical protein
MDTDAAMSHMNKVITNGRTNEPARYRSQIMQSAHPVIVRNSCIPRKHHQYNDGAEADIIKSFCNSSLKISSTALAGG